MLEMLLCVQKLVRKILGNRSVTFSLLDAAANFNSRAKCRRRRWTLYFPEVRGENIYKKAPSSHVVSPEEA